MPDLVFQSDVDERWNRWGNGTLHQIVDYWRRVSQEDPALESASVCIELVAGGKSVFIAQKTLVTTSGLDSRRFNWAPGVEAEPAWDQTLSLDQQTASPRSMSVQIPAFLLDANDLIQSGLTLAGRAEVSLQVDGGDYDKRWVIMRGDVTGGVAFGTSESGSEVAAFSVTDPRLSYSPLVPDIAVDLTRWPLAQESAIGKRYPVVINSYEKIPALRVLDDHASTGLKFLVCSPGDDMDVDEVFVNGEAKLTGDATYPWSASHTVDGKGQRVLLVDFSTMAANMDDRDAVHVSVSRNSSTAARRVPGVIRDILRKYTSLGHLGTVSPTYEDADSRMDGVVPSVLINASGSETRTALEVVESGLLPNVPMLRLVFDGAGLGLALVERRVGAAREGISGILEGGQFPLLERTILVAETPKGDLFNEFEVRYGFDLMTNSYTGIVSRNPSNSPACRAALDMAGGVRPHDPLELPAIITEAQAVYVADWLVAHKAVPSYYVEWKCLPWVHHRYRLGQNVLYTDDKFSAFTSVPAVIWRMTYSRGGHRIGLRIWHPFWRLGLAV